MATQLKKCYCALCGEELTAPQQFNGKMYGYSCILKVNPTAKKQKDTNWQPCNFVGYKETPEGKKMPVVTYNGKKYIDSSYKWNNELLKRSIIKAGDIWLINLKYYLTEVQQLRLINNK